MKQKDTQDMTREEMINEIKDILYKKEYVNFKNDVIIDVALSFELEKLRRNKK